MKRAILPCTLVSLGLLMTGAVEAAGDPAKGKQLYAVCAGCHGQAGEGNKMLNAPASAGQEEWYVVQGFLCRARQRVPQELERVGLVDHVVWSRRNGRFMSQ